MEISIPITVNAGDIESHNIIDDRYVYDKRSQRSYSQDMEIINGSVADDVLIQGNNLYVRSGDDIDIPTYDVGDESEYVKDQVIYKNSVVTKVDNVADTTITKQPENYDHTDTGFYRGLWKYRYTKLFTGISLPFTGFESTQDDTTHKLFQYADSDTGWKYEMSYTTYATTYPVKVYATNYRIVYKKSEWTGVGITYIYYGWAATPIFTSSEYGPIYAGKLYYDGDDVYKAVTEDSKTLARANDDWGTARYDDNNNASFILDAGYLLYIEWNGVDVYDGYFTSSVENLVGKVFTGNDGKKYKVGAVRDYGYLDGYVISAQYNIYQLVAPATEFSYYYYTVAKKLITPTTFTPFTYPTVAFESTDIYEKLPSIEDSASNYKWIGNNIIVRGADVYMRTTITDNDAPQIKYVETSIQYSVIETLEQFPGFAKTGYANFLNPFDGLNYSRVNQSTEESETVNYIIKCTDDMDTVAISGLIASDISIVFKDSLGNVLSEIDSYTPQTYRDETIAEDGSYTTHRLPAYYTTAIIYSMSENIIPKGSTVELNFTQLEGRVEIGTICLGLSVNAGLTNLEFQTKFVDLSPYEKDSFGNIYYVKGVKTLEMTGTCDIPITSFDMMMRLWTSIGGSTVIINGSDSKDNSVPSSKEGIFSSTMLIGRMSDFQLKTSLKNKQIGDLATYSFKVKENI